MTNFRTLLELKVKVKKKSKAVPLHAVEALGGERRYSSTHSRPRH
jgi:hypothetical protein